MHINVYTYVCVAFKYLYFSMFEYFSTVLYPSSSSNANHFAKTITITKSRKFVVRCDAVIF